ncbi:iron-sulfur cluster-binding protein [Desulfonispora thiosulfatigenes DSM 11270]|uniref:Iron-sulfur cluster-binding protein n=1 Tax=Desulfonispora thiosulfatigenes DSM 11270 TaxID=656914 RepID=A0A1W1V7K3_DESTI|nr:LUD domain-containing protein [Desulfonispora thiosulfatigenes]SMB89342.1 iron-sulfur cluster-binding protein [Desulfonispora thiosulfatigenes DSM 11270]
MAKNKPFKDKINKALNNPDLRRALYNFGNDYPKSREKAYGDIDFEELRKEVATIKANAANDFENLANQFETKIKERGANVHRAKNGQDVVEILKGIADQRNAKICVKSKSMATEEIELNHHMAQYMEMVETDLGEWILQQVGEKPSHMVMPAIHLTKERCAEIFSDALGQKVEPDIKNMVRLAREELRGKFLQADIGVSGCNIAVAETGTMCLFTNEGNARLTATLPPVHVVIFGYEKLIHNFKDVAPIAKALPKSATGQTLTAYLTMISGPTQTLKDKVGPEVVPKELHVIFLDNGRKEFLTDPDFKEMGQCIRCGSCINVCPVYQLLSGHVYGHIYPGGIGSLLTAFMDGNTVASQPQELCIGCGKCKEVCPGQIPIPNLMLEMRDRIRKDVKLPLLPNTIVGGVLPRKNILDFGLRGASWGSAIFAKDGIEGSKYIRKLPFQFGALTDWRSLPTIKAKPFRDRIKKINQDVPNKKGKIAFFGGCVIDYAYPEIGESVVSVLNKEGYEVVYPEQTCCGIPAYFMGRKDVTALNIKSNIDNFAKEEFDYIVSACPTCTLALKKEWSHLFKDSPEYKAKADFVSEKTYDLVKLVYDLHEGKGENVQREGNGKKDVTVTYHDSCHLNRELGVKEEPRKVLKSINNIKFVEMNEADRCCGFGGSFNMKFPMVATEILKRKLDNAEESKAEFIVTDCPGCMMQLRGGLDNRHNANVRVRHTAEILDKKY